MRNASVVVLVLSVVLLLASDYPGPRWVGPAAVDWLSASGEDESSLADELAMQDQLEAKKEVVLNRIAVKDALVAELVEGRRSLRDVTATFMKLNEGQPGYMLGIRQSNPGRTNEERSAHNVLAYAALSVANEPPERQDRILARLRGELDQWFPGANHRDAQPL